MKLTSKIITISLLEAITRKIRHNRKINPQLSFKKNKGSKK